MKSNILAVAATLSDQDLLARLEALAVHERLASAELVAHLAVLDTRPILYAADGYGSLFSYCTQALLLSEDAACNRIEAARACRRFPQILDLLGSGSLTLTTVRLLGRHLTAENHEAILARAANRSRREMDPSLTAPPHNPVRCHVRSSRPLLRSATGFSSRFSTVRSACSWRRSRKPSSARPHGPGRSGLSVPGRMRMRPKEGCLRGIRRTRSSAPSGSVIAASARTCHPVGV
jgi:hypothetical protein